MRAILIGYKCYLRDDTRLPMMWIDDCIQSIIGIMEASNDQLKQRTYNVAAMSFTPDELTKAIQKYKPNFKISYEVDDRQKIGKTVSISLTIDAMYFVFLFC